MFSSGSLFTFLYFPSLRSIFKHVPCLIESGANDKDFLRKAHDNVLRACNMQVGGKKALDVRIIENWMEKRILNSSDPEKLTPVRLAYEYRNYYRWPVAVRPFLRAVARRVKHKLCKRTKRKSG